MKKDSFTSNKEKDKGESLTHPPAPEHDTHSQKGLDEKFTGDSLGNKALPNDLSHDGDEGAESTKAANTREGGSYKHEQGVKGPFLGDTKGNRDLPNNRTKGVDSREGGRYVASSDRYHGGRKESPEGN